MNNDNIYDNAELNAKCSDIATDEWFEKHHCAYRTKYQYTLADLTAVTKERDAMRGICEKLLVQKYGQMNYWAGVHIECPDHGYYATGGNWLIAEGGTCPYCEANAALGKIREG